jgi:putative transposase
VATAGLAAHQKKAAESGKSILLLDETGLMLQPLVRRTWAPVGERPVMYCWDRHDRLSVIAGLTLSARRRRVGLYFAVHEANVKAPEVEAFVRRVRRQVGRDLIVVLDRLQAHRSAAKRMAGDDRFKFEWLPPYAPDLNPAEAVWCHTKYGDLANFVPEDVVDLEVEAELSLEAAAEDQKLLRSFFETAELPLT